MTPDLICGVDPGMSGGIAILDRDGGIVGAWAIPETEHEAWMTLAEFAPRIATVSIERVQPLPTGTIAMFKLGRSYGFLRGILTALQIPFDEVPPKEWQEALGCVLRGKKKYTERKALLRQKAQQLWPKPPQEITNATADALLIAEHARRKGFA